jgi:hypothetical protein
MGCFDGRTEAGRVHVPVVERPSGHLEVGDDGLDGGRNGDEREGSPLAATGGTEEWKELSAATVPGIR